MKREIQEILKAANEAKKNFNDKDNREKNTKKLKAANEAESEKYLYLNFVFVFSTTKRENYK